MRRVGIKKRLSGIVPLTCVFHKTLKYKNYIENINKITLKTLKYEKKGNKGGKGYREKRRGSLKPMSSGIVPLTCVPCTSLERHLLKTKCFLIIFVEINDNIDKESAQNRKGGRVDEKVPLACDPGVVSQRPRRAQLGISNPYFVKKTLKYIIQGILYKETRVSDGIGKKGSEQCHELRVRAEGLGNGSVELINLCAAKNIQIKIIS
jgi:hypothetical protein